MKLNPTFYLLLSVVLVASCTTTQQGDSQQAANEAINSPAFWASEAVKNSAAIDDTSIDWLEQFNDPLMRKLVDEGKANNFNLQVAAGNMDKAWLLAEQAGAARKPMVNLSAGRSQLGTANSGTGSGSVNIGLTASWELDVWGRLRFGVNAAQANAQSAQADYLFAQHSLSANIAKSYLKGIEAKRQADIARKSLHILKETLRIAQVKYNNGIASAQDVALSRANLASTQEQLIRIEASLRDAIRALEVLLGRYPSASIDIANALPTLPAPPPAGVPSAILERRPDIIAAERKIASAFNAEAQAKAARLPSFSLTSSVKGASSSLSDVLNPANVAWQLAANLLVPLLDGGKRKLDIDIASLEQQQAIANYAQKALMAFSEVETNLDQSAVLARREAALTEVKKQSAKAYRIAELRYKEGEIDLLDTLQIQQQAIAAESNLLAIKHQQLEQRINLYLALGGSW